MQAGLQAAKLYWLPGLLNITLTHSGAVQQQAPAPAHVLMGHMAEITQLHALVCNDVLRAVCTYICRRVPCKISPVYHSLANSNLYPSAVPAASVPTILLPFLHWWFKMQLLNKNYTPSTVLGTTPYLECRKESHLTNTSVFTTYSSAIPLPRRIEGTHLDSDFTRLPWGTCKPRSKWQGEKWGSEVPWWNLRHTVKTKCFKQADLSAKGKGEEAIDTDDEHGSHEAGER